MRVRTVLALGTFWLLLIAAVAAPPAKEKEPAGEMVDSGSFGVWAGGQRVATETFSIHQQAGGVSTIASQLSEEGGTHATQKSQLEMTASGALVRYEWQELAPGKTQIVVIPNNEFLLERVTESPGAKPSEHPFLLPTTSVLLDNNFLIHREVLAWRYLASSCPQENGAMRCGPARFGAIVPQARLSTQVSVQPIGEEKVTIRGAERQLLRLDVKSEDEQWSLWLDRGDHFKLIRIVRSGDNAEIVRD